MIDEKEIQELTDFATIQIDPVELDRTEIENQQQISASNLEQAQDKVQAGEIKTPKNPKFKDFDSLEKAYADLQKEFTRKSQELADLKKIKVADKVEDNTPAFLKDDWTDQVKQFFDDNEFAKSYKTQISKLLVEDENIKMDKNPLQKALMKVLSTEIVSPHKLVEDEKFLNEHIYSNAKIKEQIINNYINELSSKSTPPLITKTYGSSLGSSPKASPKTLKEVKELVTKMFL